MDSSKNFEYPALRDAAIACGLLVLKCAFTSQVTGLMRVLYADLSTPEDRQVDPVKFKERKENTVITRLSRVLQNDVENVPHFMALSVAYSLILGREPSASALSEARTVFGIFVACRYLHTTFYLLSVQPYRTLSFAGGALSSFFLAGRVLERGLEGKLDAGVTGCIPYAATAPLLAQFAYFSVTIPNFVLSIIRPVTARAKKAD